MGIRKVLVLTGLVSLGFAFGQAQDRKDSHPQESNSSLPQNETGGMFSDVSVRDVKRDSSVVAWAEWSYDDCVDIAIANNPDIRRTIISILQAEQDIESAKDAYLPTVDFATSQGFTNYPKPADGRNANAYNSSYGVNASWTVWEGNARKYRLESSRLMRRQQELAGEDLVKELKLQILRAYLNIMYSHEAVAIAKQTLEVSTAQAERARKLMEAGRSSIVEVAQIESQRAQDEYNVVEAESSLASYKMTMKQLLALGIDDDFEIDRTAFPDGAVNELLPSMDATYRAAQSWLPELRSNELSKDIYANDVKVAKAGRMPNVALQGGLGTGYTSGGRSWSWQMSRGFNEYIGLSLSVPIFDGNKTRRAVAKANIAALEYDVNRDNLLDDLSQTIENLYIEARSARARYESGIARLAAMEETDRLVNRQFELGAVNPLDLLTAHNNLLSARLEQLQNKYMAILSTKTIQFYNTQQVSIP